MIIVTNYIYAFVLKIAYILHMYTSFIRFCAAKSIENV